MGDSGHNQWGVYNKSGVYLIFIEMQLNWHDLDRDATDRQLPWEADRSISESPRRIHTKKDIRGSSPLKYQSNEWNFDRLSISGIRLFEVATWG